MSKGNRGNKQRSSLQHTAEMSDYSCNVTDVSPSEHYILSITSRATNTVHDPVDKGPCAGVKIEINALELAIEPLSAPPLKGLANRGTFVSIGSGKR